MTLINGKYYRKFCMVIFSILLCGCVSMGSNKSNPGFTDFTAFVLLGPEGVPIARVITNANKCPSINIDGNLVSMELRAKAETIPLRTTRSDPADSKPSAFPVITCEKVIPVNTLKASVDGQFLPIPKHEFKKIVVIGDTGCRLKKSDNAYQACNDSTQYPFARIASAAAAWKPDLVIHVGDYMYRENSCPNGNIGCAGSSWGYGWDAWRDDFFNPAGALLKASPIIVIRGNHESCKRAGQGWWRLVDPRPYEFARDCNDASNDDIGDYSDPYSIPLGGDAQLIVLDTSNTAGEPIAEDDIRASKYRSLYQKLDLLTHKASYNIVANHQPILGFTAKKDKNGNISVLPGNQGLQSIFTAINPLILPPRVNALLSGHVHLWQEVSFSSPHPTQFITGFSGTMEDVIPLPRELPKDASPAPGAIVEHFSSWVNGFGFMTLERTGATQWDVKVWDAQGNQVNACKIVGETSSCDISNVN